MPSSPDQILEQGIARSPSANVWMLEELSTRSPWREGPLWPEFGASEHGPAVELDFEPTPLKDSGPDIERQLLEAYEAGIADGRAEGAAAERARLQTATSVVEVALDAIHHTETRWRETAEDNLCALATAIAKQILERELSTDRSVIVDLVKRAVIEFPLDQPIRVRVSPDDLALLTEAGHKTPPREVTEGREARWFPDPLLSSGGCVVEGRERIIDGRVDSALERIYRRLTHANA